MFMDTVHVIYLLLARIICKHPPQECKYEFQDSNNFQFLSRLQNTRFLIPDGLLNYISREMKQLSKVEPYGIRGCALCIGLQDDKSKTVSKLSL